jgi:hypothetical protein
MRLTELARYAAFEIRITLPPRSYNCPDVDIWLRGGENLPYSRINTDSKS